MPLYEYQCTICHHKFEILHPFHDHKTIYCPKCKSLARKLMGNVAHFHIEKHTP